MTQLSGFGEVSNVTIRILVDNKADLITKFKATETVKYFTRVPLLAEHGFSMMFHTKNQSDSILLDGGVSKIALPENIKRLKINPVDVKKIVLSHGHHDHYTGISAFLDLRELAGESPEQQNWCRDVSASEVEQWIEDSKLPLYAHPAALRERWRIEKSGKMEGPSVFNILKEWEAKGVKVIVAETPQKLEPGVWTSGYVPRESFEKIGRPKNRLYRDGDKFLRDDIEDDQSIIINLKDRGLVIISGCAHSGIINTINYARKITGIDKVHAVIGGFHLAMAKAPEIKKTIDYFKEINPTIITATHCTGLNAIKAFSDHFPNSFKEGIVGMKFLL